jgi:hypothetical protein
MNRADQIASIALLVAMAAGVFSFLAWREAHAARATSAQAEPAGGEWLKGAPEQKLLTVEKQLRGLDVAMAEVGYRFTELYFAGQERNWDYAKYHAEKIDLALRLALERRPKRAASAQPFLNDALPFVQQAIASRDPARFRAAVDRLRTACMKCHADENVPYFTVEFPEHRLAPVRTLR